MISLTIVFCMTLNDYICRELPFGHDDYQAITSLEDCMMGGMIGSTKFVMENAEWYVKGFRCSENKPAASEEQTWLDQQKAQGTFDK